MEEKQTERGTELVAKKLRTGEVAIWDQSERAIILVSPPTKEGALSARIIKGATLKALEEALGDVVVLI
ncbi:MAG TPA: hypothetical protein VF297_24335 [Pyrinomonadaceae bacterium]